jgi:hypothetical protein
MIVISFLMPVALFLTVIGSVGFGILAAYAAVIGILNAFGSAPRPQPVAISRPRLVLVPTQNPASGD